MFITPKRISDYSYNLKRKTNIYKSKLFCFSRMKLIKSKETAECEVDQGYSSARTTPNITPSTSPQCHITSNYPQNISSYYQNQTDYRLYRASRLIEASVEPTTSMAVKRNREQSEIELDRKRYRVAISQAVQ